MTPPYADVLHPAKLVSRRREVRLARVRRVRRMLLAVAVALGLSYGGWAVAHSSLFALDAIQMKGLTRLTDGEVLRAAGIHKGQNAFSVDEAAVRRRIEALPLVASARVERHYPGKLQIIVVERVPAAVIEMPGARWLVDRDGIALGFAGREGRGLPIILTGRTALHAGATFPSAGVIEALAIWRGLPRELQEKVEGIEADSPNEVIVRVAGARAVFGTADYLDRKIAALLAILDRANRERSRLLIADVRAPERPAARFA